VLDPPGCLAPAARRADARARAIFLVAAGVCSCCSFHTALSTSGYKFKDVSVGPHVCSSSAYFPIDLRNPGVPLHSWARRHGLRGYMPLRNIVRDGCLSFRASPRAVGRPPGSARFPLFLPAKLQAASARRRAREQLRIIPLLQTRFPAYR